MRRLPRISGQSHQSDRRLRHSLPQCSLDFWKEYNRGNDPHRIKGHPCQLPIVLLEKLILTSSSSGDLIGDVFSGSGGTILAARRTGRDVIGFEIREDYKPIIEKKALFGKSLDKQLNPTTLDNYLDP